MLPSTIRIVWATADLLTGTTIAHSLDEAAAIRLSRGLNAGQPIVGRYQVERCYVVAGEAV